MVSSSSSPSFRKAEFEITEDGDFASYLEVTIKCFKDGSMRLTQEHLTQQIIELFGLEDGAGKATPCTTV